GAAAQSGWALPVRSAAVRSDALGASGGPFRVRPGRAFPDRASSAGRDESGRDKSAGPESDCPIASACRDAERKAAPVREPDASAAVEGARECRRAEVPPAVRSAGRRAKGAPALLEERWAPASPLAPRKRQEP